MRSSAVSPSARTAARLGPLIENHERFPARHERPARPRGRAERHHGRRLGARSGETALVRHERGGDRRRRGRARLVLSPVTVHLAGGDLLVELDDSMQARLTGPAQEIFIGEASEELGL